MSDYNFETIKNKILIWVNKIQDNLNVENQNYSVEISKNIDRIVIIDFTFQYCLAQLIVNETTFAPYELVSFEAMTIDSEKAILSDQPELIYFFYDSKDTKETYILLEMEKALEYCLTYIPDKNKLKYKDKIGYLNIEDKDYDNFIHPDDIEKLNNELIRSQFVCVDIQFQYLKVNNNKVSIRVLPTGFKVISDN